MTDQELDELGIGGPGEFVYIQLPTEEGRELHWEMFRDGTYYMPDMSYYNRPHMEPLSAVGSPRPIFSPTPFIPRNSDFTRWRDFYLEHPKTWPKDLTEEEREILQIDYARLVPTKSLWTPECGRDPTNLAEQEREQERIDKCFETMTLDDLQTGLTRSVTEDTFDYTWNYRTFE